MIYLNLIRHHVVIRFLMYFVNLAQQVNLIFKIVLECRTLLTCLHGKRFAFICRVIYKRPFCLFLEDLLCDLRADVKWRASPVPGICIFNYCFKNVPKRYISFHPAALMHGQQYVLHLNFFFHKSITHLLQQFNFLKCIKENTVYQVLVELSLFI